MAAMPTGRPPVEVVQSISSHFPPLIHPQPNNSTNSIFLDQNGVFRRAAAATPAGQQSENQNSNSGAENLSSQYSQAIGAEIPVTGNFATNVGPISTQYSHPTPQLAPKQILSVQRFYAKGRH